MLTKLTNTISSTGKELMTVWRQYSLVPYSLWVKDHFTLFHFYTFQNHYLWWAIKQDNFGFYPSRIPLWPLVPLANLITLTIFIWYGLQFHLQIWFRLVVERPTAASKICWNFNTFSNSKKLFFCIVDVHIAFSKTTFKDIWLRLLIIYHSRHTRSYLMLPLTQMYNGIIIIILSQMYNWIIIIISYLRCTKG